MYEICCYSDSRLPVVSLIGTYCSEEINSQVDQVPTIRPM